ncbi:MAG: alpha-L-arabinofuranosidase C-terminal domain-containing protein [Bacteroidota bacterium]|nr:alpha-L-arabinofuranosidase C-terminal domain-containing protein [Bacteroidota bacterium]
MKRKILILFCTSAFFSSSPGFAQNTRIVVDGSRVMNKIPARMFGSCIEDVNHEIYGGLYDQLLYGESFEEPKNKNGLAVSSAWDALITTAQGSFMLDSSGAYNGKQAQIIQYNSGKGRIGVANSGLNRWGIAIKKGGTFQGRIYLRAETFSGSVTLALQSADGGKTYATHTVTNITPVWQKYPFSLTANTTDSQARFALYIENKGKLWVDQAVLMPAGDRQFKNLPIRADIAVRMQQEGINFLRYGGSMVNAAEYRWKNMIGDPDKRPPYKGWWHPYTSNGFGISEFVQFCKAAGFEPAFAINIEEQPEDVANMVDYLSGDGHPNPLNIHFIEIGNEEVIGTDDPAGYKYYTERFNLLYDAIHARDPDIQVICSAWWRPKSANMQTVFKAINGKAAYWDLHTSADAARSGETVDKTLAEMQQLFLEWDPHTKMKCTIFEENGGKHDLQRALGHATTLNAVRRHGDFLLSSCAANALQPFRQNDNGWDQGQIFFTPSRVWAMPPFYAQQMASKNYQPLRIFSSVKGDLDVTATRSESGTTLIIHVINPTASATKTSIALKHFSDLKSTIKVFSLSGDPDGENTSEHPEKIITKEKTMSFTGGQAEYVFPADSYTILRFEK